MCTTCLTLLRCRVDKEGDVTYVELAMVGDKTSDAEETERSWEDLEVGQVRAMHRVVQESRRGGFKSPTHTLPFWSHE